MVHSSLQPEVTLEYQRLDRARQVTIGGLRLLGVLFVAVGALFLAPGVFALLHDWRSIDFRTLANPYTILRLAVVTAPLVLGGAKLITAQFIGRANRPAAWIALVLMGIETCGILLLLAWAIIFAATDPYPDGILLRCTAPIVIFFVLLGWLGVDYEILQVLRRAQPVILPSEGRPTDSRPIDSRP